MRPSELKFRMASKLPEALNRKEQISYSGRGRAIQYA